MLKYPLPLDDVEWTNLADPSADYLVDYKIAILASDPKLGRLDLLVEFAPNSHCHFHRHLADTTTLVLKGEQHLTEIKDNGERIEKVRKAGEYAHSPGGEAHMERGGPDGALVFFAFAQKKADGKMFELLDKDLNVLSDSTVESMTADAAS